MTSNIFDRFKRTLGLLPAVGQTGKQNQDLERRVIEAEPRDSKNTSISVYDPMANRPRNEVHPQFSAPTLDDLRALCDDVLGEEYHRLLGYFSTELVKAGREGKKPNYKYGGRYPQAIEPFVIKDSKSKIAINFSFFSSECTKNRTQDDIEHEEYVRKLCNNLYSQYNLEVSGKYFNHAKSGDGFNNETMSIYVPHGYYSHPVTFEYCFEFCSDESKNKLVEELSKQITVFRKLYMLGRMEHAIKNENYELARKIAETQELIGEQEPFFMKVLYERIKGNENTPPNPRLASVLYDNFKKR